MATKRKDPYKGFRFTLVIDGITEGGFREVSGLDATTEVVEYRNGDESPWSRKLTGITKYEKLTLKRGMTDDKNLWEWRTKVIEGDIDGARKDGQIHLMDDEGKDVAEWTFSKGWCSKWSGSNFNAGSNDVMIDTIEITHENLKRVK